MDLTEISPGNVSIVDSSQREAWMKFISSNGIRYRMNGNCQIVAIHDLPHGKYKIDGRTYDHHAKM
jgi:hypothetical protein